MIRLATPADLPAIVGIYNEAVARKLTADTEPITLAHRKDWLSQHPMNHYPVYVYVWGQSVVGWLSLSAWRPGRKALYGVAEVSYFVRQDYHRQGIASKLLSKAIVQAPTLCIKHLMAILLATNSASIALLEKYDFSKWGHLPEVAQFDDQSADQVIYGRAIDNPMLP